MRDGQNRCRNKDDIIIFHYYDGHFNQRSFSLSARLIYTIDNSTRNEISENKRNINYQKTEKKINIYKINGWDYVFRLGTAHRIIIDRMEKHGSLFVFISK